MWAFAFLDKKNERILISRDRFGKKPFYYYNIGSELYWASEIKYILKTSQHKFEINPAPVAAYLQQFLLETNEAETFFKEILKLPPGTFAWLDLKKDTLTLEPQKFYHFPIKEDSQVTPQRAQDELQFLIQDSVKIRLRSDVNVGFLLSGGLDSSLLSGVGCSLMPDSKEILKFLSVVSDNPAYDESYFIKKVENHLGIESQRINISHAPQSVFDQLSKVQWHNDEPITSLSAVTYYLMMEKAKELNTKVLISGQGADEIFCGYRKYLGFYVKALLQQKRPIKAFTTLLHFLKTRNLISEFDIGELKRYVSLLNMGSPSVLSNSLKGQPQPFIGLADKTLSERQLDDLFTFSVPALLHYEDRLSMASEREVRAPFLDYRIAEFGINLPMDFKLKDGWSKLILRKIANSYLPKDITWRSDKRGFTIPQELWFKNELRTQIETLLKGDCLIYQMNFVKKEVLLDKFSRYCDGGDKSKLMSFKEIFTPIALENWLQVYKDYLK
nr:asparagine synthase (glutamine-hydrolyzing) [Bdellovibrio sp. CKG001]